MTLEIHSIHRCCVLHTTSSVINERMWNLARLFREAGWSVTLFAGHRPDVDIHLNRYFYDGVEVIRVNSPYGTSAIFQSPSFLKASNDEVNRVTGEKYDLLANQSRLIEREISSIESGSTVFNAVQLSSFAFALMERKADLYLCLDPMQLILAKMMAAVFYADYGYDSATVDENLGCPDDSLKIESRMLVAPNLLISSDKSRAADLFSKIPTLKPCVVSDQELKHLLSSDSINKNQEELSVDSRRLNQYVNFFGINGKSKEPSLFLIESLRTELNRRDLSAISTIQYQLFALLKGGRPL